MPELLGLAPDLLQRRPQLRVEPDVAQRQADLAGELDEDAVLTLGERLAFGAALGNDEPEQLVGVCDRNDPQWPVVAALEEGGDPDGQPRGPADPGAGDHRLLRRSQQ